MRPAPLTIYPEPTAGDFLSRVRPLSGWLSECEGLFRHGRLGIYWAFRGLGLPAGTRAWLPAHHCGAEVEAVLAAGFEVEFYPIGEGLGADLEWLERALGARPGPVLAIHYYGFPQPQIGELAGLCRQAGVPLIEDCAHAMFSCAGDRSLGSFGPISVYSLYKSLPCLEGGALRVDRAMLREWTGREFTAPPPARPTGGGWMLFAKSAGRRLAGESLAGFYRRLRYGPPEPESDEEPGDEEQAEFQPLDEREGLAWPARLTAAAADPQECVARRRGNYLALAEALADRPEIDLLFGGLPEGACPLVLPVRVKRGRERLRNRLFEDLIDSYVFGMWRHPSVERGRFPLVEGLRREVVGLPVSQQIGAAGLERMVARLRGLRL